MNRYFLFLPLFMLFASCMRPNVNKVILLKYHWQTRECMLVDGCDFIFDTNKKSNKDYILFLDDDFIVYKDQIRLGTITRASDSDFTMDVNNNEVTFARWIEKDTLDARMIFKAMRDTISEPHKITL